MLASAEDLSVTLLLRREIRLAKPLCCTAALRTGEHSSSKGPGQGCCSPGSVLCLEVESLLGVKGRPECYAKGYVFSSLSEYLTVLCSGGDGRIPDYYIIFVTFDL